MTVFGWDASDFDWARGPMDVAAAVRDGIVFFTHKATEGTKIWHRHYGEALSRARAAGMPLMGAYMVPRTPGNNGHGTIPQQVAYFLAYLDQQTPWWRTAPEFFLQVDLEHWGYDNVDPTYGIQACQLLRAQTGKWVVLYAPRWAYGDTIPGDDPLWASAYGTNPAVPYRQAYPGDSASGWAPYSGRTPTFLQFGSQATIGSQPGCDINAYRGTLDQLRALITGGTDMPSLDSVDLGRIAMAVQLGRTDLGNVWGQPGVPAAFADLGGHTGADLAASLGAKVDGIHAQSVAAPTQDQVDAAVLKALKDPQVQAGIGAAIAAHLHVS